VTEAEVRAQRHELNTLTLMVAEAQDLASEGKAADGYVAPMGGLARVLEAEEGG
jgi:hypothetical protein